MEKEKLEAPNDVEDPVPDSPCSDVEKEEHVGQFESCMVLHGLVVSCVCH